MDQVLFREPKADDFAVVISVIHMQEDKAKQLDPTEALLQAAKKEMGSAMETKPEVHLFNGPEVTAAYMSMTDATVSATAPKAGEFRFLTLGYAKLGNLVIAFRMVSNRPGEAERLALIEMIKTAHFIPRKLPN
jgi:hypothetical protein